MFDVTKRTKKKVSKKSLNLAITVNANGKLNNNWFYIRNTHNLRSGEYNFILVIHFFYSKKLFFVSLFYYSLNTTKQLFIYFTSF